MNAARKEMRNVPASVRQRLLNLAVDRGEDFRAVLERFAAERFLYRLSLSSEQRRFILKGAALLRLWTLEELRPTRDLDFLRRGPGGHDAIRLALGKICAVECREDGLRFDASTLQLTDIREDEEYEGVRVKLKALLGGSRIHLQIDIGFGDAVTPHPKEEGYPTLLDHPAPRLRTYPKETFVAEKFQAMVSLGPRNTRMKDFWDVAIVASQFAFEGKLLCEAVKSTFARRRTSMPDAAPAALMPAFYEDPARLEQWRVFQERARIESPALMTLGMVGEITRSFLNPVRERVIAARTFDLTWSPGGPWK